MGHGWNAKAPHALVGGEAVYRRLARKCALAVLQIAVVRPAWHIVLALERNGTRYGHLSRHGRSWLAGGLGRWVLPGRWVLAIARRGRRCRIHRRRRRLGGILPVGPLLRSAGVSLLGITRRWCGRCRRGCLVLLLARAQNEERCNGSARQKRSHSRSSPWRRSFVEAGRHRQSCRRPGSRANRGHEAGRIGA